MIHSDCQTCRLWIRNDDSSSILSASSKCTDFLNFSLCNSRFFVLIEFTILELMLIVVFIYIYLFKKIQRRSYLWSSSKIHQIVFVIYIVLMTFQYFHLQISRRTYFIKTDENHFTLTEVWEDKYMNFNICTHNRFSCTEIRLIMK